MDKKLLEKIKDKYFNRNQVQNITGATYNNLIYLANEAKLLKPVISIRGKGSFYTFKQLLELRVIRKAYYEYDISYAQMKRAKDVLREIDDSLNLASKAILFSYKEVFLVEKDDIETKITQLTNKHNGQLSLIPYFLMAEIEKEIDEKAPKIIGFEEYQFKKSHAVAA
jgi:hypothetical protein